MSGFIFSLKHLCYVHIALGECTFCKSVNFVKLTEQWILKSCLCKLFHEQHLIKKMHDTTSDTWKRKNKTRNTTAISWNDNVCRQVKTEETAETSFLVIARWHLNMLLRRWFVTGRLFAVPLLPVVFLSHFTPRLKANILTHLDTHSHNLTSLIIKLPATFRPRKLPAIQLQLNPCCVWGSERLCLRSLTCLL